ncbi:MAG: TetR/AcrR family transcriptional regulator [Pseudomonadota bacterium]
MGETENGHINGASGDGLNGAAPDGDPILSYMTLVGEHGAEGVSLSQVAAHSGLSLAALRRVAAGPYDLLDQFAKRIDAEVLENIPPELMEDAPRERVFDVLMMRFDALQPYKGAMAELFRDAERNPLALAAWNRIALTSMYWMMIGAGLEPRGSDGAVRVQGLVLVFARAFRVWLKDDDPGMARTMAELDRRLREGERTMRMMRGPMRALSSIRSPLSFLRRRRRRGYPTAGDDAVYDDRAVDPA